MPQDYYSIITNNGLIKEAAAGVPGGSPIDLTHIAVGDSNGTSYNPTGAETALVHEVYRTTLTNVVIDEDNPNQLIVEGVINEEVGPFYIREVGIFDSEGVLFAIGKYPETFKPNLPSGSGKRLYIRMILGFANSPDVNLIISDDINNDPNFGTNVNNALAELNTAVDDINSDINAINSDLDAINSSLTGIGSDLSQKLAKAQNLADLEDVAEARDNLGLGAAAIKNTGNAVGEIPLVEAGNKLNTDIVPKVLRTVRVFTSSGTWSKPSNVTSIKVLTIGGGAGGAGALTGNTGGGGGGGGGAIKFISSGLGATESVTIGAAGTGGAVGSNIGNNGGTTSFGSHCSATGGGGGHWNGTAGSGGIGVSGDINVSGSPGNGGSSVNAISGGSGGSSAFGYGGGGAGTQSTGSNAQNYGAGGAGGVNNTAGGHGSAGIVVVWEYN